MRFLNKKIEINLLTLLSIIIGTGVISAHLAQSEFGQHIAEPVAIIGLFFIGLGVWLFLNLHQKLYGKNRH